MSLSLYCQQPVLGEKSYFVQFLTFQKHQFLIPYPTPINESLQRFFNRNKAPSVFRYHEKHQALSTACDTINKYHQRAHNSIHQSGLFSL